MMRKTLILLLSILLIVLTGCKEDDYKKALELYVHKEYDEAAEIFLDLGDYEDSAKKYIDCMEAKAITLLDNGKYEEAAEVYRSIGDEEMATISMVKKGSDLITKLRENASSMTKSEAYSLLLEAKEIFENLDDYDGSEAMLQYINNCLLYLELDS